MRRRLPTTSGASRVWRREPTRGRFSLACGCCFEIALHKKVDSGAMVCLCGSLRTSAFSALNGIFNAEHAEVRRGRREECITYGLFVQSLQSILFCLLFLFVAPQTLVAQTWPYPIPARVRDGANKDLMVMTLGHVSP